MKKLIKQFPKAAVVILLILHASTITAQSRLELLFEEVSSALEQAKSQHADVLCNKKFEESANFFNEAKHMHNEEYKSEYIVEILENAISSLTLLNESIDDKQNFFYESLQSREQATENNAEYSAGKLFNRAEQLLIDAVGYFEEGDYQYASELSIEIQSLYKKSDDYSALANNLQYKWLPYNNANKVTANKLAPLEYSEAMNHFNAALTSIDKGNDKSEIEGEIISAEEKFLESIRTANKFRGRYPSIISSRTEALKANAEQLAFLHWEAAENALTNLARNESGEQIADIEDINEVVSLYKHAESEAYKYQFLSAALKSFRSAAEINADHYSPASFINSESYLDQASRLIETDNRNVSRITRLADESMMESNKAILVSKIIQSVEAGETTWEDILLSWNKVNAEIKPTPRRISREPDFKPDFQIKDAEPKATTRPARTESVTTNTELFTGNEAEIIKEHGKIIICLTGLNFEAIRTEVEFSHRELLDKAITMMRRYPGSNFEVVGNTDNIGLRADNQKISEERAKNVYNYLVKNSGISSGRISHHGDGENNPIAENRTPEGRQANRRVDIIIETSAL